jgi:hypothetical protein
VTYWVVLTWRYVKMKLAHFGATVFWVTRRLTGIHVKVRRGCERGRLEGAWREGTRKAE